MLTAAAGIVFVVLVAILVVATLRGLRLRLSDYTDYGEPFGNDNATAGVQEPRRPPPTEWSSDGRGRT